jgi:hypothetical protein
VPDSKFQNPRRVVSEPAADREGVRTIPSSVRLLSVNTVRCFAEERPGVS